MNEKDLPESIPSPEQKEKEKQKEKETAIIGTQQELTTLKTQVEDIPVINTIVQNIVDTKDKIEPDQSLLKEIGELVEKKQYGKALSKAFSLIGKLFSFKLQQGFEHLSSQESMMKLGDLIRDNNTIEITKYINQFEKAFSKNISVSDKSDITYLMSKCKDALCDIATKKEGKDPAKTTRYEYFMNSLTNNGQGSPVGKVLLFNWGVVAKEGLERTLLNKAIQSSGGSMWEHSAIITGYDKNTGTITLTHSDDKGIHEETLSAYFAHHPAKLDILSLNLPSDKNQQVVDFVQQQKGKRYDLKGGMMDVLKGEANSDNNSFYCSELIFKGLQQAGESVDKKLVYPGQMLDILKPDYATTIDTSIAK